MTTSDERKKILKMVSSGKITAEEGAKLLSAITKGEQKRTDTPQGSARWLRIRVTEIDSGKASVNVNLPISLLQVGMKLGARFAPEMEGLDMNEISHALEQGLTGKMIDIVDEEEDQRVEIYIE